jgi:hypothetical protein
MCDPSVVADDWITKGFHLKINGVELALRPDHLGGVVFRSVFTSEAPYAIRDAIRAAIRDCLHDADVRAQWVKRISGAMLHLDGNRSGLRELAKGRLAELHYVRIALRRHA